MMVYTTKGEKLKKSFFLFILIILQLFLSSIELGSCAQEKKLDEMTDEDEVNYLREEIKKKPGDLHLYSDLCDILISAGRLGEATEAIKHVIKANPDNPTLFYLGHRNLSHIYLNTGWLDRAVEESHIIEKSYSHQAQWDLRGHIFYHLRDYDLSEVDYHGEYVNPGCTDCTVGCGNLAWVRRYPKAAGAAYKMGIIFDKERPHPYASLGRFLTEEGKLDEAEKILKDALAREPDYGNFYINLGNLERKRQHYDKAIQYFNEALKRDKLRMAEYAWADMGKTYLEMAQNAGHSHMKFIICGLFLLAFLLLLYLTFKKGKDTENSSENKSKTRWAMVVILVAFLVASLYLLFYPGSPLMKYLDPSRGYYHQAENALINALEINSRRQDVRQDLSLVYKGQGRLEESKKQEVIASKLPPYDLNRSLRFSYP